MTAIGLALGMPFVALMGPYEPEALTLFARFTTPPTTSRKVLINNLIVALLNAGIWTKLDAFYMLAAADSQAARQNWVADQYNLTAVASPTFTADRHFQGDAASSYLESGFNPTTASSPKFLQNSGHLSLWSRTAAAGTAGVDMGNGNSLIVARQNSTNNFARRVNTANSEIGVNADGIGHYLVSRTAGTTMAGYRNGAIFGSVSSAASAAPDNSSIRVCGRSGTVSYSSIQIAMASIGAGLSADEASTLYAAVNTYLQAVGAA
jgi:hypothetical protein